MLACGRVLIKKSRIWPAILKMTFLGTRWKQVKLICCQGSGSFHFSQGSSSKGKPPRWIKCKEYQSSPKLVTINFESSQCCRLGPTSDWGLSEVEIRTDLLRCQNLWSTHANLTGVQFHTRMYPENTFLSEFIKDRKKTQNCCKSFAAKQ